MTTYTKQLRDAQRDTFTACGLIPDTVWIERQVTVSPAGCWLWRTTNADGYGSASNVKAAPAVGAHRAVYIFLVGPIPDGLELDHLCRVRNCVNPDHVELVTHAENLRRGFSISSANAAKTHCVHGHPLSGANLSIRRGARECRACNARQSRESRERVKARQVQS